MKMRMGLTLTEVFRKWIFVEVKKEFVVAQWRHGDAHLGEIIQVLEAV